MVTFSNKKYYPKKKVKNVNYFSLIIVLQNACHYKQMTLFCFHVLNTLSYVVQIIFFFRVLTSQRHNRKNLFDKLIYVLK